jgi:hypothetical protein
MVVVEVVRLLLLEVQVVEEVLEVIMLKQHKQILVQVVVGVELQEIL